MEAGAARFHYCLLLFVLCFSYCTVSSHDGDYCIFGETLIIHVDKVAKCNMGENKATANLKPL